MLSLFLFIVLFVVPFVINAGWIFADNAATFRPFNLLHQKRDLGDAMILAFLTSLISWLGVIMVYLNSAFAHHGWKLPGINVDWLED